MKCNTYCSGEFVLQTEMNGEGKGRGVYQHVDGRTDKIAKKLWTYFNDF
jgi:hypothetical protein